MLNIFKEYVIELMKGQRVRRHKIEHLSENMKEYSKGLLDIRADLEGQKAYAQVQKDLSIDKGFKANNSIPSTDVVDRLLFLIEEQSKMITNLEKKNAVVRSENDKLRELVRK